MKEKEIAEKVLAEKKLFIKKLEKLMLIVGKKNPFEIKNYKKDFNAIQEVLKRERFK